MKNLGVKVSNELHQRMSDYANSQCISLSELIRASVEQTLDGKHEKVEPMLDILREELKIKNQQIEQANESIARSDTIIMQLSRQLEKQTLMLEDTRNRSLWRRFKGALGLENRRVDIAEYSS